jgi:hypothetical protein
MARAQRTAAIETEQAEGSPVTETITYVPGDGDPSSVVWGGHTFKANIPKELTGHPDGNKREQLNHEMITLARDNKHFVVGGDGTRARKKAVDPETADQYRAHLAEWLKSPNIDSADVLIARFAKERDLRTLCEVGSQDYELISSLFMPRLGALAKSDELTEEQVAVLWRNHGFNELPW